MKDGTAVPIRREPDTLDAVTDLQRELLELAIVELRLWDIFLSKLSSVMSHGVVTYGAEL